jgi:low temperature requirement protein LtrA
MLALAALWWAWSAYAWLTSATDVDEDGVRLAMLASMGAMFGVALAVPGAFGDDAVLFGVAYLLVRLLHLILSAIVARDDRDRLGALLRFAPTAIFGASCSCWPGSSRETSASRCGWPRLRSTTSAPS